MHHAVDAAPMRLLVVEDEALVAMEIETILESLGYDVIGVADTLADALALREAGQPMLALVDMQLANGESGLEIAAALRAHGTHSLFVTGNCPGDAGVDLAIGCLHKPFNDRGLMNAVDAARAVMLGKLPGEVSGSFHLY